MSCDRIVPYEYHGHMTENTAFLIRKWKRVEIIWQGQQ